MRLFVIEGLDGSGKSTQCKLLKKRFKVLKFPSNDSKFIRKYLNGDYGDDLNPYAVSSFFAIDRYLALSELSKTHKTIISDRYITSNFIYNLEPTINWQKHYEYELLGNPRPEGVIFLDMPPNYAKRLIKKRGKKKDIYESNYQYQKRIYKRALRIAEEESWHIIKCVEDKKIKSVKQIHKEIIEVLDYWINHIAF